MAPSLLQTGKRAFAVDFPGFDHPGQFPHDGAIQALFHRPPPVRDGVASRAAPNLRSGPRPTGRAFRSARIACRTYLIDW